MSTESELAAEAPLQSARGIPEKTTPTWEMELLISGATVFGLMQLPSKLDQIFYDLLNRCSEDAGSLVISMWLYAKVSLLTIIGTFLVHLFLRGYWVALVGLDSVYPGGIKPAVLGAGPLQLRVSAFQPTMPERIEIADNRATRVFGVGFGLAMLMLGPLALVLLCFGALLLSEAADRPLGAWVFIIVLFSVQMPILIMRAVDSRLGARIKPGGFLGRAIQGFFRAYPGLGLRRNNNALLALFRSNESKWRTWSAIAVVTGLSLLLVVGQFIVEMNGFTFGHFEGLPPSAVDAADVLVPQHYASTRGEERSPIPSAFIPDKVVQGPYLELYVPYRPKTHGAALRAACAQPLEEVREGKPARAALDCFAKLLDIRVDGAKISVPLDAATDPATGLRAVLAMIPVSNLASGRHEVTVARPRTSTDLKHLPIAGDDESREPERIPFWK